MGVCVDGRGLLYGRGGCCIWGKRGEGEAVVERAREPLITYPVPRSGVLGRGQR